MKMLILLLSLSFPLCLYAQNAGIGTSTPSEKLEVKNALRSTIKISSNSFSDTTQLLLSNRNSSNSGTDFSIRSIREQGLFFSSLSDLPQNTADNSLVITPGGNVGIGIVPAFKFHVNGNSQFSGNIDINGSMRLAGLNIFEFGAGVAGKEINAGKIGYNAFGTGALAFVGAGTSIANRAVYFFAEGGTTMNGPLNIEGPLRVNGFPGTAGQVLTSNGAADPTWTNSSFSNTVRFAAAYSDDLSLFPSSNLVFSGIYNLSPADVSITGSTLTVNKTGLYHIEGYMTANENFSAAPPYIYTTCELVMDGQLFQFAIAEPFNLNSNFLFQYYKTTHFSQDIYLTAPAVIRPQGSIGSPVSFTSRSISGKITGYLISE